MNHLLRADEMLERASRRRRIGASLLNQIVEWLWDVELRGRMKSAVPIIEHCAELRLADACGAFEHGLEDRLKLAG